eukprot:385588_1
MALSSRQQQQLAENQQTCFVTCSIIAIGPAIAALIVGAEYDESSPCNDGYDYFVDLKSYLLIAGGITLGWTCLSCCISLCGIAYCSDYTRSNTQGAMFAFFSCPILIWSVIWSAIGLYMYYDQLSVICQNQPIGQMIFAWSIINLVCIGIAVITIGCLCFAACCMFIFA